MEQKKQGKKDDLRDAGKSSEERPVPSQAEGEDEEEEVEEDR